MPEMTKLEAVLKYGAGTQHMDGDEVCVTNEWIASPFAGRAFCAPTFEDAAGQLIDYLDEHIGHASMVGDAVRTVGWTHGPTVNLNESELLFQPSTAEGA